MARELNPELFGGKPITDETHQQAAVPAFAKADEVRVLHLHVEALSKRMKEFESRTELMTTKVDDVVKQNKQRFERVQGHFQRQNELVQNGFNDMNAKLAQVVSRVNERKVSENAIKEMVDRHAQLVQSFELRMQQLQRVISEQELQLMNARNELRDALHELARLKKM
jgi:chromosome segregation ATPase